ncbi:MAG: PmoA family protein [Planctomycetaceae bacterium]|nr:PmoA family protein [Planctomycetaceae bacterium]
MRLLPLLMLAGMVGCGAAGPATEPVGGQLVVQVAGSAVSPDVKPDVKPDALARLRIVLDEKKGTVSVVRDGQARPVLTQNARPDFRPYIHPIVAPDGKGVLTEYSPGHHKHQTGLYWGFTRVNGRDYFHHPGGDYWKRKSLTVLKGKGAAVQWRTVYDLLDARGAPILSERQTWKMRVIDGEYLLDLTWNGTAQTDVTIDRYNYGGLFLRMPWKKGIVGDAVNAAGRRNGAAEGQRDVWVDVGIQLAGRDDLAHIAIFDHPGNKGFPQPWRIDGQLGVGPVRARLGAWKIDKGATETIRHQFLVYTGDRNRQRLDKRWTEYTGLAKRPKVEAARPAARQPDRLALLVKALDETKDSTLRAALMRGMLDGLAGRRNVVPPARWADLSARLARSDNASLRELSQRLSQIFGDEDAAARALATVKDRSGSVASRRSALRSLLDLQNEDASDLLESLLVEPALALDAIRGYAAVENATAPAVLLGRFRKMSPVHRRAVVETLAMRKRYALRLVDAVKQGVVSRDEIPAHVARSLHGLLGDRFVKVYGKVKPVARDRRKLIARYTKLLTPAVIDKADASRGRAVFKKTCAACHLLYGDGGKIGPDLTGSNRGNLAYILLNSVDPSYDVPDAYKMVTIVTLDGRVLNGIVGEEDGTRVVLKTVERPRVVVAKEDIDVRKVSSKSMMPDGQFEKMKPRELSDLIKYLRTTGQVEIAR